MGASEEFRGLIELQRVTYASHSQLPLSVIFKHHTLSPRIKTTQNPVELLSVSLSVTSMTSGIPVH